MANLVDDGEFEVDAGRWEVVTGATIERDTASPMAGSGSLKVIVTQDLFGGIGAVSDYYDLEGGETLYPSFRIRGEGDLVLYVDYNGHNDLGDIWHDEVSASPQFIQLDPITVPMDATGISLNFLTWWDTGQAVTFWIDDVRLDDAPYSPPDTTAPVITVPDPITAYTASADDSTAVVTFPVSAEDDTDGSVAVECDYESGDAFPLGETTVTCTATDAAENEAEETFTVTVMHAAATAVHADDKLPPGLAVRDVPGRVPGIGGIAPPQRTRPKRIRR